MQAQIHLSVIFPGADIFVPLTVQPNAIVSLLTGGISLFRDSSFLLVKVTFELKGLHEPQKNN